MDGYGLWLMTDTPAGPEGDGNFLGIFNLLYEPAKFPDPAPLLTFNRETVLLVDTSIDQRVLAEGEKRRIAVSISHYGAKSVDEGSLVVGGEGAGPDCPPGRDRLDPGQSGRGQAHRQRDAGTLRSIIGRRLRFHVRLESAACTQENQWDFWVMPAAKPGLRGRPILNLTGVKELDERYRPRQATVARSCRRRGWSSPTGSRPKS